MYGPEIDQLIKLLSRLPGLGSAFGAACCFATHSKTRIAFIAIDRRIGCGA